MPGHSPTRAVPARLMDCRLVVVLFPAGGVVRAMDRGGYRWWDRVGTVDLATEPGEGRAKLPQCLVWR